MPSHAERIAKLADEVKALSSKRAANLGVEFFKSYIDPRKFSATMRVLRKEDKQAADLLDEVMRTLIDKLTPSDRNVEPALNKLASTLRGSQDPAMLRNQVFKVADLLGLSLPSGHFAADLAARVDYQSPKFKAKAMAEAKKHAGGEKIDEIIVNDDGTWYVFTTELGMYRIWDKYTAGGKSPKAATKGKRQGKWSVLVGK